LFNRNVQEILFIDFSEYMKNMSDDEETLEIIKEERDKISEYLEKF
jgi:hypothetical protein